MAGIKDRLSGMSGQWNDSEKQYDSYFGGVKVDPGQYEARVQVCKIVESKSSGKLMIRREHVITEGEFTGMIVFDNMQLETPMGFAFVRRWIELMGYNAPADPADLEDLCAAITEDAALVKVQIKHSGDFVNVSVIEKLADGTAPASKEEKAAPAQKAAPAAETKSKTKEKEKAKVEEPAADDGLADELREFCKAQDIATEDDDTVEVLGERIREFKWPAEEMTAEETALFEKAGLSDAIKVKEEKKSRLKRETK